jgi:hypothetical protein
MFEGVRIEHKKDGGMKQQKNSTASSRVERL